MDATSVKKYVGAVAAATGITVSVLTGTAALVMPAEGERLVAYADPANPALATICFGETQGVKFGDTRTHEECVQMLVERLPDYILPVSKLLPDLPENRLVAYSDAAWNMGVGIITRRDCAARDGSKKCIKTVAGTSIQDLEKAGAWQKACARLKTFITAGGKVYKGLVRRREAEYKVCMGEGDGLAL